MSLLSRRLLFPAVFILCLTLPCSARHHEDLPTVDATIDKVMEAYGGSEVWKSVIDIRQTGRVTSAMRGATGTTVRSLHYPDVLQVEIRYPGRTETRVWAHGIGMRNDVQVSGIQLASMMLQAARVSIPQILDDGRERLVDGGLVEVNGESRREITLPMSEGATLTVYVDPDTGHVTRSVGRAPAEGLPGGHMEFAADYDDFREVRGALFPFREINFAQGMKTGETAFDKIEFGESLGIGPDRG